MPTLIESLTQADADSKAEAIQTYREILGRNSSPLPTDGKKLRSVMDVLGFTPARLEADLSALKEADRLAALAASLPADLSEQIAAAGAEWTSYCEATKRIRDERLAEESRLFDRVRSLQHRGDEPRRASKALEQLRRRHWQLFGIEEPAPAAPEPAVVTFKTSH